jgi:type IV pilus assembly protein PilV
MPTLKHNKYLLKHRLVSRQAGFNLVEVMIAALVISIGMLGIAGLQLVSMKGSHQSFMRHQATFLMQDVVERIRANPSQVALYNGFDTDTAGSFTCPAAKDCSAASCSPQEIVNYDRSSVACGLNQRLFNGNIQIRCNQAACAKNDIQVQISWQEREFGKETSGTLNNATTRTDNIILNTQIQANQIP